VEEECGSVVSDDEGLEGFDIGSGGRIGGLYGRGFSVDIVSLNLNDLYCR